MHACRICGREAYHLQSPFCLTCKDLYNRIDVRGPSDKVTWEEALRRAWDPEAGVFRCFYSGVPLLTEGDWLHPRYLTREHRKPRDEPTVVACAKAINDLKGTADEKTFRRRVQLLARAYERGGELVGDDRELERLMHAGLTDPQRRALVTELAAHWSGGRPFDAAVFDLMRP